MNPLTVVSWFLEWRKVRTACPLLVCKGGARAGRYMVALSQRTAALELLWSNTWGYADKVRKTYRISLFVREKVKSSFWLAAPQTMLTCTNFFLSHPHS